MELKPDLLVPFLYTCMRFKMFFLFEFFYIEIFPVILMHSSEINRLHLHLFFKYIFSAGAASDYKLNFKQSVC